MFFGKSAAGNTHADYYITTSARGKDFVMNNSCGLRSLMVALLTQ